MKVLFVCTGNICRSPTAEGVFRQLVTDAGLSHAIKADGCGIHSWHSGEAPDSRSTAKAAERGYDLSSLRARQIRKSDYEEFDLLMAMDHGHYDHMIEEAPAELRSRIHMFLRPVEGEFGKIEVPDPYYGGADGFEVVLDMIEAASHAWIKEIKTSLSLS